MAQVTPEFAALLRRYVALLQEIKAKNKEKRELTPQVVAEMKRCGVDQCNLAGGVKLVLKATKGGAAGGLTRGTCMAVLGERVGEGDAAALVQEMLRRRPAAAP
mgnify:FL=1